MDKNITYSILKKANKKFKSFGYGNKIYMKKSIAEINRNEIFNLSSLA